MGMLGSAVKAWHSGAAELIGRLIINPDNESFLLPFASQVDVHFESWYYISICTFMNFQRTR